MKGRIEMADCPYLCKGAKITCDKCNGEIKELIPSKSGFVTGMNAYTSKLDNNYMVNFVPFTTCSLLCQRMCQFSKLRWLNYEEDTELGEGENPLTTSSYGICDRGGTISIIDDGQPIISPEELAAWIEQIKEELRALLEEYEKELSDQKNDKVAVRAKYRRAYMDILRKAIEKEYPGLYDEIIKGIDNVCEDAFNKDSVTLSDLNAKLERDKKLSQAEMKKKAELEEKLAPNQKEFKKLISTLAVLFEKYTDIPAEVMAGMSCIESNSGISKYATGENDDGKINNLWGQKINNEAINYSSREIGTGAYILGINNNPIYDGAFECNGYEEWFEFMQGKYEQDNPYYADYMKNYVKDNIIDIINRLRETYSNEN